jgi:hypothetical protein
MDADSRKTRRRPPAKTPEGRENRLIGLSIDLAEKQLAAGTASAQVQLHFLKLGTIRAKLELEKIKQENELLKAKTEALESAKRVEELYEKALKKMRTYQGLPDEDGDDLDE